MNRKRKRLHIWHAYSTNDALSNDTKVNDLVTLNLTLKLKIAFSTWLSLGAHHSVPQTPLGFFLQMKVLNFTDKFVNYYAPPSKMEGYIALHNLCLSVCLVHNYVGIPQTCATYNWITLTPIDFKLRTPNNINIMMIPIALQVKVIFDFVTEVGISVLQTSLVHLKLR